MDLAVTRDKMKKVDEEVPQKYGIDTPRLMENAGLRVAEFIRREVDGKHITVYAGKGNNGGDALVAARRLHLWNYEVEVVLASENLDGIRKEELEILKKLDVEINEKKSSHEYSIALDGLLGYGITGAPRPPYDTIIQEINNHEKIISVDIPTGLNPNSGETPGKYVKPDFTVSLGLHFKGMNSENSGKIWLADISIPAKAYGDAEKYSIFNQDSLIELEHLN